MSRWGILCVLSLTFGLAQSPETSRPDAVILRAGGFTLTAAQFDAIADTLPEQYRAFAKGAGRKQFAEQIAKNAILAAEGRRKGLDRDSVFQLQSIYRVDEWLAARTQANIEESVKVDAAAIRRYYEQHRSQYERVRARHILIRFAGSPVPPKAKARDLSQSEALERAEALLRRIRSGEDFGKIAGAESDDSGSAAKGGDLGWFSRGQAVASFEAAAFQMKPGQISDPVKSEFGYHIIEVEAHEVQSLDDVKDRIEKTLLHQFRENALKSIQESVPVEYDPSFFDSKK